MVQDQSYTQTNSFSVSEKQERKSNLTVEQQMQSHSQSSSLAGEEWQKYVPLSDNSLESGENPLVADEIRTELPLPKRPAIKIAFGVMLSTTVVGVVWVFSQYFVFSQQRTARQENVSAVPSESKISPEDELAIRKAMGDFKAIDAKLEQKKSNVKQPLQTKPRTVTKQVERKPSDRLSPTHTLEETPSSLPLSQRSVEQAPPLLPVDNSGHFNASPSSSTPSITGSSEQSAQAGMEALRQASVAGIYTSNSEGREDRSIEESDVLVPDDASIPQQSDTSASSPPLNQEEQKLESDTTARPSLPLSVVIPVTTLMKAQVATPISWVGTSTEQRFRIRLSQDIKNANNTIILPKNTYFLAKVDRSDNDGYLSVQVLSVQIAGREKLIPENTLIVLGKDSKPLKARTKRHSGNFKQIVGNAILSGIEKGMGSLNTTSIISNERTSTIINDRSNIGAAVAEGFAGSLARRGNERVSQDARPQAQTVLTLKEGTKLEIIVNQPFYI
ncbi:hypothetical protein C7B80_25095 [Cyanosarcina cf. burmensis CCALA 770]|nr:hypothetical protein C7B80_25095 [Cyanosarcina cf. burmensis CCALA 770]